MTTHPMRLAAVALVLIALVACAAAPTAAPPPTATPPALAQASPTPTDAPPTPTEAPPTPTEAPPTPTAPPPTPTEPPPTGTPTEPPPTGTPVPGLTGDELIAMGEGVYAANCQGCHGAQGQGVPGAYPALAGSSLATAEDPAPAIERVLLGRGAMPSFAPLLSDEEVAAVLSYIRQAWENDAPAVTVDQVEQVRSESGAR